MARDHADTHSGHDHAHTHDHGHGHTHGHDHGGDEKNESRIGIAALLTGGFMGVELAGKTLGLIGCGNIGSIVADRAQGLKMKVIAFDPFLSAERAASINVEKVELDDIYKRADFISMHFILLSVSIRQSTSFPVESRQK